VQGYELIPRRRQTHDTVFVHGPRTVDVPPWELELELRAERRRLAIVGRRLRRRPSNGLDRTEPSLHSYSTSIVS
jgi:hypothetical protein